jgi:Zn-dependent peptidase ImmA (M78 family)
LYWGFKKRAEELSIQQREVLGLLPQNPLPCALLAGHLGIRLIAFESIPGISPELIEQLKYRNPESWSAFTICLNGKHYIFHNPSHSSRRHESDIMHEISHILCKHQPAVMSQIEGIPFPLRTYDKEQEDEAAWLGGCLQIPRQGLLWALRKDMDNAGIAAHFNASEALVRYRRRVTGVDVQYSRTRTMQNRTTKVREIK